MTSLEKRSVASLAEELADTLVRSKQADWSAAKDFLSQPSAAPLTYGLVGAGLGGGAGLLSSALSAKRRRRPGESELSGAVAGGLTGAGLGALGYSLSGGQSLPDADLSGVASERLQRIVDSVPGWGAGIGGAAAGSTIGSSLGALSRGARSMTTDAIRELPDAAAESYKWLRQPGRPIGTQLRSVWEALRKPGANINLSLSRAMGQGNTASYLSPGLRGMASKGITNNEVRALFGRGMLRPWRSAGGIGGGVLGALLPYLIAKGITRNV